MLRGIHRLNNLLYSVFAAGLFLEMTLPDNCFIAPRRAIIVSGIITYTILVYGRDYYLL